MNNNHQNQTEASLQSEVASLLAQVAGLRATCSNIGPAFASNYLKSLVSEKELPAHTLIDLLSHPAPQVRHASLSLLTDQRYCSERPVQIAEKLATSDPDPKVQLAALHYLGKCFDGTRSEDYSRFYAAIILDSAQPHSVRLAAYQGLIFLHDLAVDWIPPVYELRFPDDVDWAFVKNWLPCSP